MKSLKCMFSKAKFLMLGLLVASTTISCSKDDDNDIEINNGENSSVAVELETPKFADISALYKIQSNEAGIESIELTESGNYIIKESVSYPYYSRERKAMLTLEVSATRAGSSNGIISGRYIKHSDTEFTLEGWGRIVITGSTNNAVSIVVTKDGEESFVLSGEMKPQTSDSDLTKALCRSWKTNNVSLQFKENGKIIFDKTRPATEYFQIFNDLSNVLIEYYDDEEMIIEAPSDVYPSEVIFTRAGSYMVKGYHNVYGDVMGLSVWKWENESAGILRFSHDYENMYDDEYSGVAKISFDNKNLVITESMSESEDGMTIEMILKTICTEIR